MQRKGYLIKALVLYTQAQNKGVKKFKGIIKDKIRVIINKLLKEL